MVRALTSLVDSSTDRVTAQRVSEGQALLKSELTLFQGHREVRALFDTALLSDALPCHQPTATGPRHRDLKP